MIPAEQIATDLLTIGAVTLAPNHPFLWASGMQAPIYTDNRRTIAFPQVRTHIADGLANLIKHRYPTTTVISGVATAGIPHAALVADRLSLPMSYVRAKPKDHGKGKQIEGQMTASDRVVLIDDLISTGGSVLAAAKAVRKAGATVLGVVAIFSYELPDSVVNFQQAGLALTPLTTYSTLITVAQQQAKITAPEMASLRQWREDPWGWMSV
ncbi:orotate phosphoribosyltransferase [Levilactobacillus brevis]|nr:orotate phosphoribosyltransferase [Levilactobacillus brevis]MBS0947323.1 orotate phosphoribosyltransferase [Levilactobacillus brevis]MBS0978777.1 orotate phosphoribosyltransferase [Levilactobacillus brevis]MBS1010468.1 orotate phosphoribosyltransferase [Levilactobacillus brevis]MCT3571153.1 orotate phosphoribosyltransferase [Levilactobacillus brevis]MCT3572063.1 orotate phosphoribosyltransferase [Levilactobacillus brevis]